MLLDTRTMFAFISAGCFIMAVALTLANVRGAHMRAVTGWALGSYVQGFAWALYGLRGTIPDFFSADVAFALMIGSYLAYLLSIYSFSLTRPPLFPLLGAYICGLAFHAIIFAAHTDERSRILVASPLIAVWSLLCAFALIRLAKPQERMSGWMTGGFFSVLGVADVLRAVNALLSSHPTPTLLSNDIVQTLTFAAAYVTVIGTSLGFIMMTKERADTELLRVTSIDALTGLLNRRSFEEAARKELARAQRAAIEVCVLMCDLDHFKDVNDAHGHPAGDRVLAAFGQVLRENLRPFDIVGRYGGEEFCIILPSTNISDALITAERIRCAQAEASDPISNGTVLCTVSIGVAAFRIGVDMLESVVKDADDALYAAKGAGRNCICLSPTSLVTTAP